VRHSPFAIALLATLAACDTPGAPATVHAPADSAAGETAFEFTGPNDAALIVPVHVNGEGPFRFVLDTGATITCVEDAVAQRLALPAARGVVGVGAGVEGTARMRLVRVDSLRVGAARAEGLTACALDLAHTAEVGVEVDGLLGLDFLRAYRVTLDFDRQVLLLQAAD
jgi:predicted aspartyl protease